MCIPAQNGTPVISVIHFFNRDRVLLVFEDDLIDTLLKAFHDNRQHVAVVQTVDNSDPSVGRSVCVSPYTALL